MKLSIINQWVQLVTISFRYKKHEGDHKCSKKACIIAPGDSFDTDYIDREFTISRMAVGVIKTTVIEAELPAGKYTVGAFGLWKGKEYCGNWF